MTKAKDEKIKRVAALVEKRAEAAKVKLEKKKAQDKKKELAKDKKEALEKKRKLAKDKKEALAEKKKIAEDKKAAKILLSLAGATKKTAATKKAPATKKTPATKTAPVAKTTQGVSKSLLLNNDIIQIRKEEAETLRKEIGLNTAETSVCVKKGAELLKKFDFVVKRLGVFHPAHQKTGALNKDIIQIRMKEADALRKLIELNTTKTAVCVKKGAELVKKLMFVEKRLEILHPTIMRKKLHTADGKRKPAPAPKKWVGPKQKND